MKTKIKRFPLSSKLPLIFISSYVVLAAIILMISTFTLRQHTRMLYSTLAAGITKTMQGYIEVDKIDDYIVQNYSMPEYHEILQQYAGIKTNYPDIKHLRVYKYYPNADYATVIFDPDVLKEPGLSNEAINLLQVQYSLDQTAYSNLDALTTTHQDISYILTHNGEQLFTYIAPVYDQNNHYVCSMYVDFDITHLYKQNTLYILQILTMLFFVICVVLHLDILIIRVMVSDPITQMATMVENFTYDSEESIAENYQAFRDLELQKQDEIGVLYTAFSENLKRNRDYLHDFKHAQHEAQAAAFMAYKDELTRVGNKAEYEKQLQTFKTFNTYGIVMVDVNNLKYINDTFGHDKGDIYLKDCCQLVCQVFAHSPVCRIGGDEFVVLLTGHDYEHRNELVQQVKSQFEQAYIQGENPWNKLSAAVGLAIKTSDQSITQVVQAADLAMYQAKREFKALHPDAVRAEK